MLVVFAGTTSAAVITSTTLDVSAAGTGADILNTGTLVTANHFGHDTDNTGNMQAAGPVTLDNGLTFGTSVADMTSGWYPIHNTTTDAHNKSPLVTNPAFDSLTNTYFWIAYSSSVSDLDIPGLTVGNDYRLQLISPNPASATVSVEGDSGTWSGSVPALLTATWTAGDDTANVVLTRTGGEIDFIGYALHDVTPPIPEPVTMALMGLAFAGLGGYVKRRRKLS